MMEHLRRPASEAGFTIIEVIVAAFVLLVGVLGTIALIDASISVGSTSRSREAATNLTRELVETAREVDYNLLLTNTAPVALQSIKGLEDKEPATAGWQVPRRGDMYTLTVESCIFDDPKDGIFAGDRTDYCPRDTTGDPVPATVDANGDDYRKLTITAAWDSRRVRLISNIVNPAGGFGPRITAVSSSPLVNTNLVIPVSGTTSSVDITVTTTTATSLNWDAGDSENGGQLDDFAGATSWPFTWSLGTPPAPAAYTCSTEVDWVPDAPAYQMTFQPFDVSGTPGDLRTQTIAIDRSAPYKVCDLAGGRNPRHGGIIELQWRASIDGDLASYSVWRKKLAGESEDKLVCDAVRATECTDNPPVAVEDGALDYYVTPRQDNFALGPIDGPPSDILQIAAVGTTPNSAPLEPVSPTVVAGAQPRISWTASASTDVSFYRIYRGGQAIADRYGKTSDAATFSFIDKDAGGVSYSYYVSAVDNEFAESGRVLASTVPGP